MEYVKMHCRKAHTYNLRFFRPGDEMLVKRKDFRILEALGRAVLAEGAVDAHEELSGVNVPQVTENASTASEDDEKAALRAEYKELFGKNAAGRMSVDGLRAAIKEKKEGVNG